MESLQTSPTSWQLLFPTECPRKYYEGAKNLKPLIIVIHHLTSKFFGYNSVLHALHHKTHPFDKECP